MKIIILAAGRGKRLMPLTRNTPKPLLDLGNGKTLFEQQLEQMQKSNAIDEIVLVIGYLAAQIEAKMKFWKENGLKITTIYNPFYAMANNLISLWLAKNQMDQDFIITNGDNLLESDVFSDLVNNHRDGIFLTICKRERYGTDDMKVILDDKKNVVKVSKLIENEKANAESIGLVLVSGEKYREIFKESLEELARNKEYLNKYWLEVFNLMCEKGIPVNTFEINKSKWQEIDFHPELEELRKKFKKSDYDK
jgi:L-glutamine-phosphate cytidylyltransferase